MGFQIHEFDFKIGDAGVSQSDDGSGGTNLSFSVTLVPPFGGTIINVVAVEPVGVPNASLAQPDLSGATGDWSVSATSDNTGVAYPMSTGTIVLSVYAIVAY